MKIERRVILRLSCVLIFVAYLAGCGIKADKVEEALRQSGTNRINLEKVLRHFENDSLKYAAAQYIISNMPYNYSASSNSKMELEPYYRCYSLFSIYGKDAFPMVDSIKRTGGLRNISSQDKIYDIEVLDSTFLINHIESVFKLREELPWCSFIPDSLFIRYVLPYRIKDEVLSDWRDSVLYYYRPVIDSLVEAGCKSPLEAARALMTKWNEKEFSWTSQLPSGPSIGINNVFDKAGTCREFAHGAVYLMRAAGIPSGVDMVPIRGENNSDHSWPFVLDENGETYVASTEDPTWKPAKDFDISAAKIYREEFGINEVVRKNIGNKDPLPLFFSLPMYSDVTREYKPTDCFDLEFEDYNSDGKPVFLLLPGNDKWVAVDISVDCNYPKFKDVCGGVIAWLGSVKDNNLVPLSSPFVIDKDDGSIRYIEGGSEYDELVAYAKFPLNARNGDLVDRVIGGVIEGSDSPFFSKCDTVFQIVELPKRKLTYQYVENDIPPHRYYRYYGAPGSYCNVAEIALFEHPNDSIALTGRIFGTPGSWDNDTTHTFQKVFDGDTDTSFDFYEGSGGWAAIDLGKPVKIRRIMYAPRNRDNYVRPGDEYELFYFQNYAWQSSGRWVADADSIACRVPVGALYYLRNHTRGKDERIFEYDFKKHEQLFW